MLSEQVLAEPPVQGKVRLVTYGWESCAYCALVKSVVLPLLEDECGAALETEERDAGIRLLVAPLFFIQGASRITLAALGTEEMHSHLSEAIQAAQAPSAGGFQLFGLNRYRTRLSGTRQ